MFFQLWLLVPCVIWLLRRSSGAKYLPLDLLGCLVQPSSPVRVHVFLVFFSFPPFLNLFHSGNYPAVRRKEHVHICTGIHAYLQKVQLCGFRQV